MLVVPRHRQVRSFETNVLVSLLGRVYVVFKAGDICIFREHIYIGRGYVYFFSPWRVGRALGMTPEVCRYVGSWGTAAALWPSSTFLFSWCLGGSTALPSVCLHNFPAYEGEPWNCV